MQAKESTWPREFLKPTLKRNKFYREARRQSLQFLQKNRMYMNEEDTKENDMMRMALHAICTQMSAKEGFKKIDEEAVSAIFKEYKQLNDGPMPGKTVVEAVDMNMLTDDMKSKALDAVNLIKIKSREMDKSKADLALQGHEPVASPPASLEALLASLVIVSYEGRNVAIFDVPGACLHKITGEFVNTV